jgi:hypothetical protein
MGAFVSAGASLLFFGLFFWTIHSMSVLRLQMDEVLARLERIEAIRRQDQNLPDSV